MPETPRRQKTGLTVCLVLAAALLCNFPAGSLAKDRDAVFGTLKKKLADDGFDPRMIRDLYDRPGVRFDAKGISAFFTYRESRLNYGQFTEDPAIAKAKEYIRTHNKDLLAAEKRFGVGRHVITAIILVETKLGSYLGNRSIFNTLSTMAALSDPDVREAFWNRMPKKGRLTREQFETKASAKSRWAYAELKAFLQYAATEKIDPVGIKGSFAGAMGIAQFMPSNITAYGRDGSGDGKIDLFNHADAIASIANYLKRFGWKQGMARKEAYNVLLHYNYSKQYADTILKVVERLRG